MFSHRNFIYVKLIWDNHIFCQCIMYPIDGSRLFLYLKESVDKCSGYRLHRLAFSEGQ